MGDFLRKAKQLEYLITVLPSLPEEETGKDFEELELELQEVNKEYLEALSEAGTFWGSITSS